MQRFLNFSIGAIALTTLWASSGCAPAATSSCLGSSTECNGTCVELRRDPLNCGACGTACPSGEVCSAGQCAVSCQAGLTDCSGTCANTATDNLNCGACGTACPSGELCSAGKCAVSCQAGLTDCSGTCASTATDNLNCGACGNACPSGELCSAGKCAVSCQAGLVNCNGSCVDPLADRSYCGASGSCSSTATPPTTGQVCPPGYVCSGGGCALSCQTGLTDCSGTCANTATDRLNCGACGTACPSGEVCSGGACAASCPTGEVACNGTCAAPSSDPTFCGVGAGCSGGAACGPSAACYEGACQQLCPAGQVECSGSCLDPTTSATHCGASGYCTGTSAGQACATGQTCVAGVCTPPPCVWTTVASYPLDVQPAGSTAINGAIGGQGVTSLGGRSAWVQTSDWNYLYLSPGVSADVVSVEADFYVAPPSAGDPRVDLDIFQSYTATPCTGGTQWLTGGVDAAIFAPPTGAPSFQWFGNPPPGSCSSATASDTRSIATPTGAWHHLQVAGVRSTCRFDVYLDGALIATETGACNTTGPDVALFGRSGNTTQLGWTNWTISTGNESACVP